MRRRSRSRTGGEVEEMVEEKNGRKEEVKEKDWEERKRGIVNEEEEEKAWKWKRNCVGCPGERE